MRRSYQGPSCTGCNGKGGQTETAQQNGKRLAVWRPCPDCGGRGTR